jgi:hydrogenase maturation protein HypF
MKNTVGVAAGDRLVLSPHIGDLGNASTQRVFARTVEMLGSLHATRPAAVAHDLHPDYSSTHYARQTGLPLVPVQHHLAHVLSCLLEHRHPADGVLGIAWDGTGYGEDGTVWGGEFILLQGGQATRFARLRPFRLPGGEAAVRDPRRVALGLVHQTGGDHFARSAREFGFSASETATLGTMLAQGLNSPLCSSAGRLFDAVGALLRLNQRNTYEGQTPLAVEAAAWSAARGSAVLPLPLRPANTPGAIWELDWEPMLAALGPGADSPSELAAAFHRALAAAMVEVARLAGVGTVALTGGCFQNVLLGDLAADGLTQAGFRVLQHRELSPNDGSIAAGQALGALWNLTRVTLPS